MISKGTTHNNGVRLANYMVTGKNGERAELGQMRGFEATHIRDAFRDVQLMAKASKCQQPFFHVQVRNRDGEQLTPEQWERTADRIESMLGLTGQPRAIAFHTLENGNTHMHVAWSRIREDSLTAIPLPFFKQRLKKLSRELELEFALEPVTDRRKDNIKFAPTRAEQEQARRLGLDIHEIRADIRACYDRSDCGTSFQAALEHEGYILAQGERRDFIVIDGAGGLHALGKRILDASAAQVRARLSDLDRDILPSVSAAREIVYERRKEMDRKDAHWDRDVSDREWQESIIDAALEREDAKGIRPGDKRREGRSEERTPSQERPLDKGAAAIRLAYSLSHTPEEFTRNLDEAGFRLARATPEDVSRSRRRAAFSREIGRFAPAYREGEFVAIDERGHVYGLNRSSTGEERAEVQAFLRTVDNSKIEGIETTREQIEVRKRPAPGRELWDRTGETAWQTFGRASYEIGERERAPEHIKGPAAAIWTAYRRNDNARDFVDALEERGFIVAVVNREDQTRTTVQHFYRTDESRFLPKSVREGDFVAVAENGRVYNLDARTTGEKAATVRKFMAPLDRGEFRDMKAAVAEVHARGAQREIERQAYRDLKRGYLEPAKDTAPTGNRDGLKASGMGGAVRTLFAADRATTRAVGKSFDIVGDLFESLLAPVMTPKQRLEAELKHQERQADQEKSADLSRLAADTARQREEAARQLQREREAQSRER